MIATKMWHSEEYSKVRTKIVQRVEGVAKLQGMVKKKCDAREYRLTF